MLASTRVGVLVIGLLVTTGCGKSKESVEQSTATKPGSTKTCAAGQLLKGDACVTVVTPQKIENVKQEAKKFADMQSKLTALKELDKPLASLDKVRKLDIWKAAAVLSSDLKDVDTVIDGLANSVKQMQGLSEVMGVRHQQLVQVASTLQTFYNGGQVSFDDATKQVSGMVNAIVGDLDKQVADFKVHVVEPAMKHLAKVEVIMKAVCSMGQLGGGADLKKICETALEASTLARTMLTEFDALAAALVPDLSGGLMKQLQPLLDADLQKLLGAASSGVPTTPTTEGASK